MEAEDISTEPLLEAALVEAGSAADGTVELELSRSRRWSSMYNEGAYIEVAEGRDVIGGGKGGFRNRAGGWADFDFEGGCEAVECQRGLVCLLGN